MQLLPEPLSISSYPCHRQHARGGFIFEMTARFADRPPIKWFEVEIDGQRPAEANLLDAMEQVRARRPRSLAQMVEDQGATFETLKLERW